MKDTDRRLIDALRTDARASVSSLAAQLGMARTTVQARLTKLEQNGTIAGYGVRLGDDVEKGALSATVLLELEQRACVSVTIQLKKIPNVISASTTSGRIDMVLDVSADTTEELSNIISEIGQCKGVQSSESIIHLSSRIKRAL